MSLENSDLSRRYSYRWYLPEIGETAYRHPTIDLVVNFSPDLMTTEMLTWQVTMMLRQMIRTIEEDQHGSHPSAPRSP